MPSKCEAPRNGGASRNSCGGSFREFDTRPDFDRQALSFHVRQFVPEAQGAELEQRIALLIARDYAASLRGNAVSRRAYDHACNAHEIAGDFVFAAVPPARLANAVSYCRHAVMCAFLAEYLDNEGFGQ